MADRDLRIRMLLEAADKVSRPLRDIAGGSTRAAQALRNTRDQLRAIERAQADIAGFRQLKVGTRTAEQAMLAAKSRAAELGRQLAATENPSRALSREFARARDSADRLEAAHQEEVRRLGDLRDRLRAAGIATTDLARHERELRDRAASTNAELAEQTRRLEALNDRQRRFSAARDRFSRGQQLGASLAVGGTAAIGSGVAIASPLFAAVGAAQRYQSVMTDIAQKGDLPRAQAERLGRQLLVAAKNANQLPEEIQRGVDALTGLGASVPDAAVMMPSIGRASTAYKAEVGDMAAATYAVRDNLKVAADQTGRTIDIMAQAGKRGAFEMKDMASAFPALTAAYQGLGQKGLGAVADLSAGLQIARKGAGDSATAGTNLANVLQKIASPATNRAFAKMGVDLPAALQKAYREGKTPLEAIAELTNKTLKGDLSKLGYLFEDAQVQQGLRPLIQNLREFRSIRAEAMGASGTTDRDFAERMQDSAEKSKQLTVNAQVLAATLGTTLLPTANAVVEKATALASRLGAWSQRHPTLTKYLLLTAGGIAALLVVLGGASIALAGIIGPIYLFGAAATYTGMAMLPLLGTVALVIAGIAALAIVVYAIYANWGSIGAFFSGLWASVTGFFAAAWTRITSLVGSGVAAATGFLLRFNPLGILWSLLTGALDVLGALLPARFTTMGRSLIAGLIGGITGMLGQLRSTIVNAAASAANWFKSRLGIRSPSRVFAGFGGFMMSGLDAGIASGADAPVRRVDAVSRRLTRALAAGAAIPMVATIATAAAPGDVAARGGRAATVAAPASRGAGGGRAITINIYGAPGQSPEDLANAVAAELDKRERAAGAAERSSLADRTDDWG